MFLPIFIDDTLYSSQFYVVQTLIMTVFASSSEQGIASVT